MQASAIARAKITKRSLIPVSSDFTSGMDALGNFRLSNGYYRLLQQDGQRQCRLAVALRHRLHRSFSQCRLYRLFNRSTAMHLLPTRRLSRFHRISTTRPLFLWSRARARPPRRASEITFTSVAVADTMSFLNDVVLVTLGVRQQNVKQDSFQHCDGSFDEQLRRIRSDVAPGRRGVQALAQCFALRELR